MDCTPITIPSYDDEYYNTEQDNLKWYYDLNKVDKIGFNSDGTEMTHDSMTFSLKSFRRIEEKILGKNTVQIIFKLSTRVSDKSAQINTDKLNREYFGDLALHEKSNYVTFKYVEHKGKMTFTHIVFNGKEFK